MHTQERPYTGDAMKFAQAVQKHGTRMACHQGTILILVFDGSWSLVLRPPTVTGDTTAVNSCLAGIVCRPAFLDKYSRVTFSERRLVTVREQWGGSGLITIEVRLAVHCRAISSRALALCGWMCICGCVRARMCACVWVNARVRA